METSAGSDGDGAGSGEGEAAAAGIAVVAATQPAMTAVAMACHTTFRRVE
ncbi:hypothetical protein ACIBQX_19055 [Nonomuraea sp. NPDC049714]